MADGCDEIHCTGCDESDNSGSDDCDVARAAAILSHLLLTWCLFSLSTNERASHILP